jgi:hypothetical protein
MAAKSKGWHEYRTVEIDPDELVDRSLTLENGWKVVDSFVLPWVGGSRTFLVISKWHDAWERREEHDDQLG